MRKRTIAFVWLLVAVSGLGSFKALEYSRKTANHADYVEAYKTQWTDALRDVLKVPPPAMEDELGKVAGWRRGALRREFRKLDEDYQATYKKSLEWKLGSRLSSFRSAWNIAIREFGDEPSIDKYVNEVHESHRDNLRKRLTPIDQNMREANPRTRLALDSFLGYAIFRSPEFKRRLFDQGVLLHLVDDGADYKKRIGTLEKGDTPLAAFTIDALIATSATRKEAPATVVMMIDESRGADAIVANKDVLPNLGSMNNKDVKIVLTADSPSETLARVVKSRYLARVQPDEAFEFLVDDPRAQENILKRFKEAGHDRGGKPTAYVLWEPYVSMALKIPGATKLVDSSDCPGYIVDVLVVQKAFLTDPKKGKENRELVRKVIRAYLETLAIHQKDMAKLLREDWQQMVDENKFPKELDLPQSQRVVQGIRWKNTSENYAHFSLQPDSNIEAVEQTINRITEFMARAGTLTKKIAPKTLFDPEVMKEVRDGWSAPKDKPATTTPVVSGPVRREDCEEVTGVTLNPIGFQTGSDEIILELAALDLHELAGLLKEWPKYYLEIRGHALGKTDEDRDLAQKRAAAVSAWLQKEGSIGRERLFIAAGSDSVGGKSSVSFVMLKKKEPKGGR